jgi:hypothetical protein
MALRKVKKNKVGRKTMDPKDKVKNRSTYLSDADAEIIRKKYGSTTQAIREEILTKIS